MLLHVIRGTADCTPDALKHLPAVPEWSDFCDRHGSGPLLVAGGALGQNYFLVVAEGYHVPKAA